MCGIRAAGAVGTSIVEVDVRRSLDGVPFLLHDRTLRRTATGHGPIRLLPARNLGHVQLRGSQHETLPSLANAFDALPDGVDLGLHLKDQGSLRQVLRVVERTGLGHRTWLWVHRPHHVRTAQRAQLGLRTVLLNRSARGRTLDHYIIEAEQLGATAISVPWGRLDEALVSRAHTAGLLAFSVLHDPARLDAGVPAGVDGIITSQPDEIRLRIPGDTA